MMSDIDDPQYDVETESSKSENESLYDSFGESDDELKEFKKNPKKFKESLVMNNNKSDILENNPSLSDDSEFGSDELRSESSSSDDENHKIGYIGPPNPKKRKRIRHKIGYGKKDGVLKWHVGMKFASMAEFRDAVRQYGIRDRWAIQFVTNDPKRCQVYCEADCKFYIWCSKDNDSENCTIKTLFTEHNRSKPYRKKLASVKYLT